MIENNEIVAELNARFGLLEALREYEERAIYPKISQRKIEGARDCCFFGMHRRASANVGSILALRHLEDFRAVARVTRSLFELNVELKLLDIIPDAVHKITAFSRLERLRSARKIVAFNALNGPNQTERPWLQAQFIEEHGEAITAESKTLWAAGDSVEHWTGLTLKEAVSSLGQPLVIILELRFPELLWQTNSDDNLGLSLTSASYASFALGHIALVVELYVLLLKAVIEEVGLQVLPFYAMLGRLLQQG